MEKIQYIDYYNKEPTDFDNKIVQWEIKRKLECELKNQKRQIKINDE